MHDQTYFGQNELDQKAARNTASKALVNILLLFTYPIDMVDSRFNALDVHKATLSPLLRIFTTAPQISSEFSPNASPIRHNNYKHTSPANCRPHIYTNLEFSTLFIRSSKLEYDSGINQHHKFTATSSKL